MVLERIAEVASTTNLKQERTRHVNRVHKLLEETNIKLSSDFADLMCKTERAILHELAAGEANPEVLADLALLRAPEKRDALVPALQGCMRAHHRFLLQELLGMIDTWSEPSGGLTRRSKSACAHSKPRSSGWTRSPGSVNGSWKHSLLRSDGNWRRFLTRRIWPRWWGFVQGSTKVEVSA